MTETKKARTPEQKAAHAARERARYAAKKAAEQHADEIVAERDAAEDFIDQAIAAHPAGALARAIMDGTVPANATLADLDSVTLYRKVKEEVAERKTNPDVATPHLDELNARKGRKVTGAAPKAARTSTRTARHPLFDAAEKRRAELNNKRGKGIKVTPEELIPVAARLRAEGLTERQACEVAYWVENLAVARTRWATAWAATETIEKGAAI